MVKIADFGMSKVTTTGTYVAPMNTKLAVRWTAPEVVISREFSKPGDVWSYGILCWEILQRSQPYFNIPTNGEVLTKVCEGVRLPRPTRMEIPNDIWKLLQGSWNENPKLRPDFAIICSFINSLRVDFNKYKVNAPTAIYAKSPALLIDQMKREPNYPYDFQNENGSYDS